MLQSEYLKFMAMAFGGFTIWTVGDAIIRYCNEYPPLQVGFFMSATYLLLIIVFQKYLGGFQETWQRPKLKLRILRGFILSFSAIFSIVTFANLELAKAYAIIFAAPFVAKIFSVLFTGEKIGWRSWSVTILGFFGVLIVLRPGTVDLSIGTLAALGVAFFFGIGHVMARVIGHENQTLISYMIFNAVFLVLISAGPTFLNYVPFDPVDLGLIIFIGFSSLIGSLLVASAFAKAPTAFIAPIHYTQILFGTLWGALFFKEFPDGWTIAGSAVIIGAGLMLIFLARRKEINR